MKIAIVTGSRADWSALEAVYNRLSIAHHEIDILHEWRLVDHPDSLLANASAMSDIMCRIAGYCAGNKRPDLAIVLGDRYEILAVSTALYAMWIPIAHLSGGDVTTGSADGKMRDAI